MANNHGKLADYVCLTKKDNQDSLEYGGGYLLSERAQKELIWCIEQKIARIEYDPKDNESKYYLADGTEIQRRVDGK